LGHVPKLLYPSTKASTGMIFSSQASQNGEEQAVNNGKNYNNVAKRCAAQTPHMQPAGGDSVPPQCGTAGRLRAILPWHVVVKSTRHIQMPGPYSALRQLHRVIDDAIAPLADADRLREPMSGLQNTRSSRSCVQIFSTSAHKFGLIIECLHGREGMWSGRGASFE
jgi:hypothetical protein